MIKKIQLPKTPSKLIRLALHDFRKIEKDKRYRINMGDWHSPRSIGEGRHTRQVCQVCLAGSVMARRGGCRPDEEFSVWRMHDTNQNALDALDSFRIGNVVEALYVLGYDMPEKGLRAHERITPYCINPGKFKRDMRKLATRLKKAGL
jgi:hypothetical protein